MQWHLSPLLFWEAYILVYLTHAEKHGVEVIGHLKKGLNPLTMSDLAFGSPYLMTTIKTGVITGVVALAEGIAVGRSFAMFKNYQTDGNKEMIALGMMNMVGSCTSSYVTTGPFSRSAVNFNTGCKTAVSNIVMAMAVLISLLRVLLFVARPRAFVLGNIPNSAIYRSIHQYPVANNVPGVLILQIDAPIYFANASYLRERISRWIYEEEDRLKLSRETSLQYVILDMSCVGSIDTSGISMLEEVNKIVDRRALKCKKLLQDAISCYTNANQTLKLNITLKITMYDAESYHRQLNGSHWIYLMIMH
ncbi:hypothetical protein EZV62_027324 [Acer yangbiense]|uniref:STAS domain-containing protein n=1 Tax=Acer yangbiense TaxID=1000413 RepID=A0A5C7GTY4_9ROSI|nr:hypothetical protein EZV62_027324 [Acer yangbiense]